MQGDLRMFFATTFRAFCVAQMNGAEKLTTKYVSQVTQLQKPVQCLSHLQLLIIKLILDAKDQRLTADQILDNLMQDPPFALNRFEIRFQFDALLEMNAIE